MKTTKRMFTILLLLSVVVTSCKNDKDNDPKTDDLEQAKLTDFPLFGISPVSIEIIDPVITDDKETEYGQINIVLPTGISLDAIASSITSKELNLNKFDILPGNNTRLSYETQSHIHTIINKEDNTELLHYTVTIQRETTPNLSSLTITDFKFEASKNPSLANDVVIEHREQYTNNPNKEDIYLFLPSGVGFSDLTPTISVDAEEVYYTQDVNPTIANVNTPYPTAETSFDFTYPKKFIIVLRDNDNDRMKWVNVFVDVKNPVELENTVVTTADVTATTSTTPFLNITQWKNVGNHKIEYQTSTTYENNSPASGVNFITARRVLVVDGLEPGESAGVNAYMMGNLPADEYKTTAVFYTRFVNHDVIDDFVEPAKLNITTNVIN